MQLADLLSFFTRKPDSMATYNYEMLEPKQPAAQQIVVEAEQHLAVNAYPGYVERRAEGLSVV